MKTKLKSHRKPAARTQPRSQQRRVIRRTAERIAAYLFTDGGLNKRGTHLRIQLDDGTQLGGWSLPNATNIIEQIIKADNASDDRQLPAASRPEINHDENSG